MHIASLFAIVAMAMPVIVSAAPVQSLQSGHAIINYADKVIVQGPLKRGACEDKCNGDLDACIRAGVAAGAPQSYGLYCSEVAAKCRSRCRGMSIPRRSVSVTEVIEKCVDAVLVKGKQADTEEVSKVKRGVYDDMCNDYDTCIKTGAGHPAPWGLYCSEMAAKCRSLCRGMIIPPRSVTTTKY
jgi:hypothetical protein